MPGGVIRVLLRLARGYEVQQEPTKRNKRPLLRFMRGWEGWPHLSMTSAIPPPTIPTSAPTKLAQTLVPQNGSWRRIKTSSRFPLLSSLLLAFRVSCSIASPVYLSIPAIWHMLCFISIWRRAFDITVGLDQIGLAEPREFMNINEFKAGGTNNNTSTAASCPRRSTGNG